MTNMELVKAMRSNLFADRGTDVEAAFEDAFAIINRSKEAAALSTALMVIVNTIANVIEANEKETVQRSIMAISKKDLVKELHKIYYRDFTSRESDSAYSLKRKCDVLAGIAHIAMQTLEENNIADFVLLKHDDVRDWWKERKLEIQRRNAEVEAKARKAEIKARALARLTEEEKEALGLKKK